MADSLVRAYEQYDTKYQHVTKLILDRFNYFIISSAFLVGAFVTTAGKSNLYVVSLVLALIGITISSSFTLINYVNIEYSKLIGEKRNACLSLVGMSTLEIYTKLDRELEKEDRLDKYIEDFPLKILEMCRAFSSAINPLGKAPFNKLRNFNTQNYFSYTWFLPLISSLIWIIPIVALAYYDHYTPACISFWVILLLLILLLIRWGQRLRSVIFNNKD